MNCDGTFSASARETEPTAPDVNGYRWRTFESTGRLTFTCSHGLTVSGPREHASPLVRQHLDTQG